MHFQEQVLAPCMPARFMSNKYPFACCSKYALVGRKREWIVHTCKNPPTKIIVLRYECFDI